MRWSHRCAAALTLLGAIAGAANVASAQVPTQKEMEQDLREMQRALDQLTPEQRKMIEQALGQTVQEGAPGADDDAIGVPRRDAARIARLPRQPLTGTQLKAHVESLQPRLRRALAGEALRRAEFIEDVQRKAGGDPTARLRDAANALAAWGAWPEATFLMGKVVLASGQAQDLNNLAAFLTILEVPQAAVPILITLDARYPGNSTILNNLGQAWFQLGEINEAERVLLLAVRRTPEHPQANVTKSRIEQARGDTAAAVESMRAAIRGGFSEDKAQRMAKLGGKLGKDDLRWGLKKPADGLGLGRFLPPAYAKSFAELIALGPQWHAFDAQARQAQQKLEVRTEALRKQQPWLADIALRGPLIDKVRRMQEFDNDNWRRRRKDAYDRYTLAVTFYQEESRKLYRQLHDVVTRSNSGPCRHVPGGCNTCPEEVALINRSLATTGTRLEEARQSVLEFERTYWNDFLYYAQFTQMPSSFELTVSIAKTEFLRVLHGPTLNDDPGLLGHYCAAEVKPASKTSRKLPDFDEVNCQRIISFDVGFGRWQIRCNRADIELGVKIPLEAVKFDANLKWSEDLIKDRVIAASLEIGVEDLSGTVRARQGGHIEFDDRGAKSGGVSGGVEVGVGRASSAGPLAVGVKAGSSVGVEFGRGGVTDVWVEGGVKAQAGSTIGKTDSASPGVQATTEVAGRWSWNAGTSAGVGGNFDRKFF